MRAGRPCEVAHSGPHEWRPRLLTRSPTTSTSLGKSRYGCRITARWWWSWNILFIGRGRASAARARRAPILGSDLVTSGPEHAPDDAKQQLAERVVEHLEQSGFDLDEEGQALRKRPPLQPHGMPRGE